MTNLFVDEALRAEEHPGIIFRPGPTGRRAGLAGGPDVWAEIDERIAANREAAAEAAWQAERDLLRGNDRAS